MRAFLALIDKEWRDARPLTMACAAMVVIVSVSYHAWLFRVEAAAATASMVVPACIALYAGLLAADLVASDRRSGVLSTLSLLPIPLRRLWLAKVAFFVAAVVLFAVWVIDCQAIVMLLRGGIAPTGEMLLLLADGGSWIAEALLASTAILLCSTIGLRSFASVIVGVALALGANALIRPVNKLLWLRIAEHDALATMAVGFLFASLVVFVRGRIHVGARWRPAFLGLGVLLPALLLALMVSSARAMAALDVDPRAPESLIQSHQLSPSGEYLALTVTKEGAGPGRANYFARQLWVLRTDDGALHQLPGRVARTSGWSAEGLLHFRQWRGPWSFGPRPEWIEPGVWTHREPKSARSIRAKRRFSRLTRSTLGKSGLTRCTSSDSGLSVVIALAEHHYPRGLRDGKTIVYAHRGGGLRAYHLDTETEVELAPGPLRRWLESTQFSHDGAFMRLPSGTSHELHDIRTGERVTGPWDGRPWRWLQGATESTWIEVFGRGGGPTVLYEVGSSARVELRPQTAGYADYLRLPDGAFLAFVHRGKFVRTIERLAPDGTFERRLFPPREAE